MQPYLVIWEIEVDAESAQEAANLALAMQRDPTSTATQFTVQTEGRDEESVDGIPVPASPVGALL